MPLWGGVPGVQFAVDTTRWWWSPEAACFVLVARRRRAWAFAFNLLGQPGCTYDSYLHVDIWRFYHKRWRGKTRPTHWIALAEPAAAALKWLGSETWISRLVGCWPTGGFVKARACISCDARDATVVGVGRWCTLVQAGDTPRCPWAGRLGVRTMPALPGPQEGQDVRCEEKDNVQNMFVQPKKAREKSALLRRSYSAGKDKGCGHIVPDGGWAGCEMPFKK